MISSLSRKAIFAPVACSLRGSHMSEGTTLENHLAAWASRDVRRSQIAVTLIALAGACRKISELVSAGPLAGALGATRGDHGAGDVQKEVDLLANHILLRAMRDTPVAALASEELDDAVPLEPGAPLLVAIDPLDGSSNIDANVSIGTIFSILPAPIDGDVLDGHAFLQPGDRQLAAGY